VLVQSAETVGVMYHAFDMTMDWVNQRVAFGRVIGSYQALKHRLADHKLWLEASAGLVDGLAAALATDDPDTSRIASITKAHVGDTAVTIVQDAVQMHGGIGVTWEHDLHLYLRRATANRALYGSPIQHRERLCALAGI
jgi:alkylation response protein AidB-like acyl-CoA dehydrogenase